MVGSDRCHIRRADINQNVRNNLKDKPKFYKFTELN